MTFFTGSGTALVTPFTDDGINYESFAKHIDFQLENGTAAFIVCGTTGEPSTMTAKERASVIEFVIKESSGRVPVIAGVGGNNTQEVIENSQEAQKLKADGVLAVVPYYNKTTQKGLIKHFTAVADCVDIPVMIYNVPSRTVLSLEAVTLAELAQHKNISAIKEASGDLRLIQDMVRLCGDNIDMYCGDDHVVLPLLASGGKGVVSVISNIAPKESRLLVESYMAGDISKARQYQYKLNPLNDALFCEVNPIPVKTAMNLMGMEAGKLRLPLCEMEDENLKFLISSMKKFGLEIKG
ncbi:MAG: 4-hydroxy-tetrahydrodipicolinate synthase [Desulfocapsa sp.]|nr:4-hydroxy-tetrahydrodipicolinate synthase [Desulfocapsa sp.]